jgi:putative membrane-bound dehydrogenase-like protein
VTGGGRLPAALLAAATAALLLTADPLPAAQFTLNGQRFTVPDGFVVELAAGTNLVPRPVNASFDDRGRLYVTDSSGSNEAPQKQLEHPTHRILRLEDVDGDGQFDQAAVFADKVMFPEGCLWHEGSVYVAAPPSLWKFTDTTGAGAADKREEWFKGGTLTGCANDLHGPYRGPDGFIYWTKGAFAAQTHPLGNGRVLKDRAAHIYRARPDGSGLDVVMSGGMDNPVAVAFTAEGEPLFTSTFIDFSQPGFRDGIGHATYGAVFGKANEVLEDGAVKRAGPDLAHPFFEAGPAAECGLCRYQGGAFGPEFRDNLFATTFNLHKITRHILRPSGASYASTDSDFLVSDGQDFHPTDVLEDADGSLLVVDTGGWYKLCCPSSQLTMPEALGAIYRVRRQGSPRVALKDRAAAYQALTRPPALPGAPELVALREMIWANDATDAPRFRAVLGAAAAKAATNPGAAHETRLAAEGLGRLRDAAAVPVLLEALGRVPRTDPVLQSSLVFALIEIASRAETRAGLGATAPAVQRGALIALDQMDGGDLQAAELFPFLRSQDEALGAAALWIFHRHPDWAAAGAGLAEELLASPAAAASRDALLPLLAGAPAVQTRVAQRITSAPVAEQLALFNAVAAAHPREFAPEWAALVRNRLGDQNPALVRAAVAAAAGFSVDPKKPNPQAAGLAAPLVTVAEDATRPSDLRLGALLALPGRIDLTNPALLALAVTNLDAVLPTANRAGALEVLQRARLDPAALGRVAAAIPHASPLELTRLLAIFEKQTDPDLGRGLLTSLAGSPAARNLPPGNVKVLFERYPEPVQAEASAFIQSLNTDTAQQAARLEALLAELNSLKGDTRRGQTVFNSPRTLCTACHKIGYLGGTVGPDLTSIGQARTERDLLESITYPSASFVRGYEPVIIATKSGDDYSGVLKKDSPEELILATGPNAEVKIPRADVTEIRPGKVSVMPQGLDAQLTRQELADLIAFLKNTKWGPQ